MQRKHHSTIPPFQYSNIPLFPYSTIPFSNSGFEITPFVVLSSPKFSPSKKPNTDQRTKKTNFKPAACNLQPATFPSLSLQLHKRNPVSSLLDRWMPQFFHRIIFGSYLLNGISQYSVSLTMQYFQQSSICQ